MDDPITSGDPLSPASEDAWTLVDEESAETQPFEISPKSCPATMGGEHDFKDTTCTHCGISKVESNEAEAAVALQKHWKGKKARKEYQIMKSLSQSDLASKEEVIEEKKSEEIAKDEKVKEETRAVEKSATAKKEEEQRNLQGQKRLEEEKRIKVTSEKDVKGSKSNEKPIELKFILIGDAGVGKTNLLSRFVSDEYTMNTTSTISVAMARRSLVMADGQKIQVAIWDTAGQERYRSIARSFYKGLNAIFIVYDCSEPHSLTSVSDWYEEVRQHCDTNPEMILVGNKIDLAVECSNFVTDEDALVVANEQKMILFNTSAKTSDNCQRVLHKTVELCYDKIVKGEVTRVIVETSSPQKAKSSCC